MCYHTRLSPPTAWYLFGAKPSFEPMLDYCQLDLGNKFQLNFNQNWEIFLKKFIWKFRLPFCFFEFLSTNILIFWLPKKIMTSFTTWWIVSYIYRMCECSSRLPIDDSVFIIASLSWHSMCVVWIVYLKTAWSFFFLKNIYILRYEFNNTSNSGGGANACLTTRLKHKVRPEISNHQPHDCLLNCLFRRRWKKTSKLRVTGLCAGDSPVTGEFPAQIDSNAENVSIWWRHHIRGLAEQALFCCMIKMWCCVDAVITDDIY